MADFNSNQSETDKPLTSEFKLLTSHELLQHSFDCVVIAMSIVTLDGKLLTVNSSLCRLLGYSKQELIGLHYQIFFYADDVEVVAQLWKQILQGECQSFQVEQRFLHKDGSVIWGSLSVSFVHNEDASPKCLMVQIQDISERKCYEHKLEESRSNYRSLVKYNPDMIFMLDEAGKLVDANPAVEAISGYSKQELCGKSIQFLIVPEYLPLLKGMFEQAKLGITGSAEGKILHKQGHQITLEINFIPKIKQEHVEGSYLIAKDVTKRKQNEAMIDQLHTKNQLILNAVTDGIFGIDEHLGTIFWNQAAERLTGYTYEDMVGSNAYHILTRTNESDEALQSHISSALYRTIRDGIYDCNANEIFYTKNGDSFPVEYMTSPIFDENQIIGVVMTFKNIAERQHTEEMLRKSEKLSVVGQLAAGVAHEIRNPLTSLKGFIQFLQQGAVNKQEYYDIMMSELTRIELIITEMLVLAKPQLIRYQPKSIEAIVQSVITLLETQANMNNIQFVVVMEHRLPLVHCEENQLKQSFINVIKNAMEAMPDGGQIDIHMQMADDTTVRVIFKDRGSGIPDHVLARLGEPFYSTKEKGTGLGLMTTSKIIEDHHGQLMVESKVGEGTVVSVTLPIT
ncbi:PAS domain S-box protein [Paenibacillus alba]|uniref:histidine kinase n=1 Tax=Paenibacillus alba TaxID=1197127 RepID=A0ABU6GDX6_9BACL|nr:PAS domain S-box protein [Paenibacillus alba]MEC0232416.1 PAS domain S-box protein [Paenibacillus alba]